MEMSTPSQWSGSQSGRRRVLYSVICATCHECGFATADKLALDLLIQIIQSLIFEIGRSSRAFCELSGRTEPLIGDVVVALIEMGLNCDSIASYGLRPNRVTIPSPQVMSKQNTPRILQAGEKKSLSSYIPDYFPDFPDPHSYIRTPTHKQPVTEYEAIREKSATQKRDVERALTRFMAKTCEPSLSHTLFPDEQMCLLFPLIALKLDPNPYLNALLPKDQVFDDEDSEEQQIRKKELEKKPKPVVVTDNANNDSISNMSIISEEQSIVETNKSTPNTSATDNDLLDNPYLRPVKLLRKRTRKHFEG
jgi:transcription initiation factor TFIID subunit 8